jgi:hypothetical protein
MSADNHTKRSENVVEKHSDADHPEFDPTWREVMYHQKHSLDFMKDELVPEATDEQWSEFCLYHSEETGRLRDFARSILRDQFFEFIWNED